MIRAALHKSSSVIKNASYSYHHRYSASSLSSSFAQAQNKAAVPVVVFSSPSSSPLLSVGVGGSSSTSSSSNLRSSPNLLLQTGDRQQQQHQQRRYFATNTTTASRSTTEKGQNSSVQQQQQNKSDRSIEKEIAQLVNNQKFHDALQVLKDFVAADTTTTRINSGILLQFLIKVAGAAKTTASTTQTTTTLLPLPYVAEQILQFEFELENRGRIQRSTFGHYRWVIMAWANSTTSTNASQLPEAGQRAESILLANLQQKDHRDIPTVVDYNWVMKAYLNSISSTSTYFGQQQHHQLQHNQQGIDEKNNNHNNYNKIEQIFKTMPCFPNETSYIIMSQVYAKTGNTKSIEQLIQRYYNQYNLPPLNNNNQDNNNATTATPPPIPPESAVYLHSNLLNAYANARDPYGAENALWNILSNSSKQLPQQQGSSSSNNVETQYVNIVLKAWMRSGEENKFDKALEIMDQITNRYASKEISFGLDRISYHTVMFEMAKEGMAKEATLLYQKIITSGDNQLLLDTAFCNLWIKSFVNNKDSTASNSGQQADIILREMTKHGIQPDVYTYRGAYQCWQKQQQPNPNYQWINQKRLKELQYQIIQAEKQERETTTTGRNRRSRSQTQSRRRGKVQGRSSSNASTTTNHPQKDHKFNNSPGVAGTNIHNNNSGQGIGEGIGGRRFFSSDSQPPAGELSPPPRNRDNNNNKNSNARGGSSNSRMQTKNNTIENQIVNSVRQGRLEDALKIVEETASLVGGGPSGDGGGGNNKPLRIQQGVLTGFFQRLDSDASQNNPTAAVMAEKLLELEYQLRRQGQTKGMLRHHSNAISAWRKSGRVDAGDRAQAILEKAEDYAATTKDPKDRPRIQDYNHVMSIHAFHNNPEKAESVLSNMPGGEINPDQRSYTVVANAYLKKAGGEEGGKEHLDKVNDLMKQSIEKGIPLNVNTVNSILEAWSKIATTDKDAAKRMEEIYGLLPIPDTYSNNYRLNTYANAGDPRGAEEAFRDITLRAHHMPEAYPPVVVQHLNCVLKAWIRSNEPNKFERALEIMDDVQKRHQSGQLDFGLSIASYHMLMNGYAQEGLAKDATKLYQRLVADYNYQGGNATAVQSDASFFNLWLKCFATCGSPNAGDQAEIVLDQMKEHNVKPDGMTYSTAIRCWQIQSQQDGGRSGAAAAARKRIHELRKLYNENRKTSGN